MVMQNPSSETESRRKRNLLPTVVIVLFVALAGASGASIYFYHKYQTSRNNEQAKQTQLLERLSKILELPNETPAIVTVADKSKLQNSVLAAHVDNNDQLLIFGRTKRLIVYRPSSQKVVDMLTFSSKQDLPDTKATTR